MDNFRAIYRILRALEASLDYDEPTADAFSADALGVSENRRDNLLWMMQRDGYVDGVTRSDYFDGTHRIDASGMRITIRGLEYLHENSMMARAANAARGIAEVI